MSAIAQNLLKATFTFFKYQTVPFKCQTFLKEKKDVRKSQSDVRKVQVPFKRKSQTDVRKLRVPFKGICVGKYASEPRVASTLRKYKGEFTQFNESTVRSMQFVSHSRENKNRRLNYLP